MSIRVKRASQWLMVLAACSVSAVAIPADAQDGMRPVPRFAGTSIRDKRTDSQKASASTNLQWRTSDEVAQIPTATQASDPATLTDRGAVATAAHVSASLSDANAAVQQVKYQNKQAVPGDDGGLTLPPGLQSPPTAPTSPGLSFPPASPEPKPAAAASEKPLPDFFTDPFAEGAAGAGAIGADNQSSLPMPSPAKPEITNELRAPAPQLIPVPAETEAIDEANSKPKSVAPADKLPEDQPEKVENPFDSTRGDVEKNAQDATKRQLEDFDMPLRSNPKTPDAKSTLRDNNELLKRPMEFSCDKFRSSIAAAKIQDVSLDISPPFRPDVIEVDEYQKLKSKFDESQKIRDWQSIDGRVLGRGRLRDLAYENVVIETEFGTLEELPVNRISEADLAYLSKNWGLPQECLIDQPTYQPRSWLPSTVTWKASNLCHKPLYFEEVNLERYGHDAGPFAQPVISTAHFFANIAVLPYKMGVHAPSECQYTLGYYRPGNCAPWIVPPVPISLRGGLYQAAAMTGTFWLIP